MEIVKFSAIGSVKIDSLWRRKLFINNLRSLKDICPIISWRVNIVGKYAYFTKLKILEFCKDAIVTTDDDSSYYKITKEQIEKSESDIILFWEEDNWFLCPCKWIFYNLLYEFKNSHAEILNISHLITSWETKALLPVVKDDFLYIEYSVNKKSQEKVWEKYPTNYLTGITAIYKKRLALDILEFNKELLKKAKSAREFEMNRKKGEIFLINRSFIEMVSKCHIFREVFRFQEVERVIGVNKALKILKLRERGYL